MCRRRRPALLGLALVLPLLLESLSSAQMPRPPVPRPPDPFEHEVDFDLVKRFGSKVPATERVFMQLPWSPSANNPLLLLFHGAYYDRHWLSGSGTADLDVQLAQLMDEASIRGWIIASLEAGPEPDGGNGTYGGPEVLQRITAVIEELDTLHSVDADKIYTLGFSMGATEATAYAARMLDPYRPRIAAAFSWSGVLSTEHLGASATIQKLLWASGPPVNGMMPFIASSIVQVDPNCMSGPCSVPGTLTENESLIFNLADIPLQVTHSDVDICAATCGYATAEALQMVTGELPNLVLDPSFNSSHTTPDDFDAVLICDFFDGECLPPALPLRAYKTLAVEDLRYFYFDVRRQNTTSPGVFGWDFVNFGPNTLQITDATDVQRLTFRVDDTSLLETPLVSTSNLSLDCNNSTRKLGLHLENFQTAPTTVLLDGLPADPLDWDYDAATQVLTLKPKPAVVPGSFAWDIQ